MSLRFFGVSVAFVLPAGQRSDISPDSVFQRVSACFLFFILTPIIRLVKRRLNSGNACYHSVQLDPKYYMHDSKCLE
jgi:hypothetical protein